MHELEQYLMQVIGTLKSKYTLTDVETIIKEGERVLFNAQHSGLFHKLPKKPTTGVRPGDDFEKRASWETVLTPFGWHVVGRTATESGETVQWARKGSDRPAAQERDGKLFVYAPSVNDLPDKKNYSKFHAFTILNYNGNWKDAARALALQGYGSRESSKPDLLLEVCKLFQNK